ncbi:MAG: hypothetical protein Q8S43_10260 [Actinomycetota bacterium]|nr:hypothetical protein [Actinomycetota bacterium]MDP3631315.1 hypothetical protein [Actinomycetota bacterium]
MRTPIRFVIALTTLILVCTVLSACDKAAIEYVPNGGTYTLAQAEDVASGYDMSEVENVKTSEGPSLRRERLLELREAGTDTSLLADALTRDFPSDTPSVPLLVESATVDGVRAWLVVEAYGDTDGTLSRRRLWVLDRSNFTVLASSSFN